MAELGGGKLSAKDKQGLVLLSAVGALLALFFAWKVSVGDKPKADADNCVEPVRHSSVILIDHSDHATRQTHQEIIERALEHVRKLAVNSRVTLFTITRDSRRELKPIFSACRPPEDGNSLVENVKKVRRAYEMKFMAPLKAILAQPISSSEESPIAQTITDISLTQNLRAEENSLLVFSDMLENSKAFSLYGCANGDSAIAQFRKARRGAEERPRFRNVGVTLNLIPRYDLPNEALACRAKFWAWFFGDAEGALTRIQTDYLPGGDAR